VLCNVFSVTGSIATTAATVTETSTEIIAMTAGD